MDVHWRKGEKENANLHDCSDAYHPGLEPVEGSPAHYHRWHCRAFVPAGVSQLRIAYTPVNLTFPAELMAAQLATTLSGFTGNLFADQEEMVEDADSDRLASWEKNYLAPSGRNPLTHAMWVSCACMQN